MAVNALDMMAAIFDFTAVGLDAVDDGDMMFDDAHVTSSSAASSRVDGRVTRSNTARCEGGSWLDCDEGWAAWSLFFIG